MFSCPTKQTESSDTVATLFLQETCHIMVAQRSQVGCGFTVNQASHQEPTTPGQKGATSACDHTGSMQHQLHKQHLIKPHTRDIHLTGPTVHTHIFCCPSFRLLFQKGCTRNHLTYTLSLWSDSTLGPGLPRRNTMSPPPKKRGCGLEVGTHMTSGLSDLKPNILAVVSAELPS